MNKRMLSILLVTLASSAQATSSTGMRDEETKLTELPNLANLELLNAYPQTLTQIPETIGGIPERPKQSMSFRDYYYGNAALGIPSHQKEIAAKLSNAQKLIHGFSLNLSGIGLTDIIGLDQIPRIQKVSELNLANNYLTSIPDSISRLASLRLLNLNYNDINALPASINRLPLSFLSLGYNPIPMNTDELRKELGLGAQVHISFKTPEQEMVENELFTGIKQGNPDMVREAIEAIASGRMTMPSGMVRPVLSTAGIHSLIDLSRIRDQNGAYVLHAVVNALAQKIKDISNNPNLSGDEKAKQIAAIERRYIGIFGDILQSTYPAMVENMLLTRNRNGQDLVQAAIGILKPSSAFVRKLIQFEHKPTPVGEQARRFPIYTRATVQPTSEPMQVESSSLSPAEIGKETAALNEAEAAPKDLAKRALFLRALGLTLAEDNPELIEKAFRAVSMPYKPSNIPAQASLAERAHFIEQYKALERARNYLLQK